MSNFEKLDRSMRASRLLDRWLRIQVELFMPNMDAQRTQRIKRILDRLIERYNALTPWGGIEMGGAK